MVTLDTILAAVALATPPVLIFAIGNRFRAFIWSVVIIWLLAVVGAQYHLAYTPGYDSIAPGLSLIVGWIPAALYSSIWILVAVAIKWYREA